MATDLSGTHGGGLQVSPSHLTNFRDLGGLPVVGGRMRSGSIWRSDDPSLSPDDEVNALIASGLSTVIDLRSPQEADLVGRGPLGEMDVDYHHLPLTDHMAVPEVLAAARLRGTRPQDMADWYLDLLDTRARGIVHGIRICLNAPGAALFHCSAGKDRTGVFAAALLHTAGASPEVIVADYARTQEALLETRRRLTPVVDAILGVDRPKPPPGTAALGAEPDIMRLALADLDSRPGGLSGLLERAGLTREMRAEVRDKYVET